MDIKVYGADWCPKTGFLKNYLQSEWLDFDFLNVEEDENAANHVREKFNGKLKFPMVEIDGKVLLNPNVPELRKHLPEE